MFFKFTLEKNLNLVLCFIIYPMSWESLKKTQIQNSENSFITARSQISFSKLVLLWLVKLVKTTLP